MGMAASQARLLSITSRLTNNEFRAQTITNSKLRLAEKSAEASSEYMDALSSQSLVYGVYSDNGEYSSQKLTPALLYDYAPLKNQYALVNPAGKMLVSAVDAKNFENSDNLYDFLSCYGLVGDVELLNQYNEDMKVYEANDKKYNADMVTYNKDMAEYNTKMAEYNKNMAEYNTKMAEYNAALKAYEESQNQEDLAAMFEGIVGTSANPNSCYYWAMEGHNDQCYLHILNFLIDYDGSNNSNSTSIVPKRVCVTSCGDIFTTDGTKGALVMHLSSDDYATFAKISQVLDKRYCDGDDNVNLDGNQNLLQEAIDKAISDGKTSTNITPADIDKLTILKSDYQFVKDNDGNIVYDETTGKPKLELKTLRRKAIDMYYIIQNSNGIRDGGTEVTGLEFDTDLATKKEMLINFTEGDMKKVNVDKPEKPEKDFDDKLPEKPVEPVPPVKPIKPSDYDVQFNDKDKSQWYINLWYSMNGSETANKIKNVDIVYNDNQETIFTVENMEKSGKNGTYEVFEDLNLFKSSDWLQFALEHGMVSMVQAQYDNPANDSGKVTDLTSEGITWKSIIYTNAADIRSQDDEVKIALAEVKYKNAVREIENKDKKFDQDLKKLDTEHTALQSEYDSIKEVISKNTDRSFKAFS